MTQWKQFIKDFPSKGVLTAIILGQLIIIGMLYSVMEWHMRKFNSLPPSLNTIHRLYMQGYTFEIHPPAGH
jgi:hypothetical protein